MGPSGEQEEPSPPRNGADLEQVVRAGTEALLLRVGQVFVAAEGWSGGLRAVAYELRAFLVEDPGRARAMMLDAPHGNGATRKIREEGIKVLTLVIDRGREEREDPGSVPPSVAQITAGAIYNRIHVAIESGIEALDDDLVRELMFTAVLPYLGTRAAVAELSMPRPDGIR